MQLKKYSCGFNTYATALSNLVSMIFETVFYKTVRFRTVGVRRRSLFCSSTFNPAYGVSVLYLQTGMVVTPLYKVNVMKGLLHKTKIYPAIKEFFIFY